jgi:murein DD-endopeptidase MepM/ murein hydrolase activator NlpD
MKLSRFSITVLSSIATLALLYSAYTGPDDLRRYPSGAASAYRLPWVAGVRRLCIQSNRGIVSHRGREEFAFDFGMPVGSEVCAARGGVVIRVVAGNDGHGPNSPNNLIAIDHGDGTSGWYLHLQKNGSLVAVGDRISQGQPIARSGHVGRSLAPHLHFDVRETATNKTLPVSFSDVPSDLGVPRMLHAYTAGAAR